MMDWSRIPIVRSSVKRLMQLAVDDDQLCRIVSGARLAGRDLEQAPYLGFGRMLGRECRSRAFERRAHGVELHQLLRIEVGDHHAVPRTVGEQALGDNAMERLARMWPSG